MMPEVNEEPVAEPGPPYSVCPRCGDLGWWLGDEIGFRYCTCPAGARAQEEDEGGD